MLMKINRFLITTICLLTTGYLLFYLLAPKANTQVMQWKAVNKGIETQTVQTLAINARNTQIIYAGTQTSGIFKTTNRGISWQPINQGLTGQDVRALVIDPNNSEILYAAIYGAGVFKSLNGGSNWSFSGAGIPTNYCINPLIIDPVNTNTLYVGHYT